MGFFPQFTHDVFISYARFDNAGDERWVSRFTEDLKRALTIRLGQEPSFFFDERTLQGNEYLSELKIHVTSSGIFVPVVTPSYVTRDWTNTELNAFRGSADDNRVFAIDALPLDSESSYPPLLRQLIRKPFWHRRPDSSVAVTVDRDLDRNLYQQLIATLAENIRTKMVAMKQNAPENTARQSIATVLLAEVTADLELDREQLRSHLEQYGISVIPDGAYPGGGADFAAAVAADCRRANYFIQLLGPYSEGRPPDLPEGYSCHQYDAAGNVGLKRLLWCRPDMQRDIIDHHRDAILFGKEELVMTGLNEFKSEVVRLIMEESKRKAVGGKKRRGSATSSSTAQKTTLL
ncbi:toll/interleukin-1 receptor domain-containing protein [Rhizobium ruizarguesonis]